MDSLFLIEDDYEKFERDGDPPPPLPKTPASGSKPGVVYIEQRGFSSHKYLRGTSGNISYSPFLKAVNLYRPDSPDLGLNTPTPLDMAFLGHRGTYGPDCLQAKPAEYESAYLGRQIVDGLDLIGARFLHKQHKEVREFWLDPARGFLPARMNFTNIKGLVTKYYLMEARECSGHRWFPERVLMVRPPAAAGKLFFIRELRVLELDADRRPGVEAFSIDVPVGTQVLFNDDATRFFYLKQNEKINSLDIPELFDKVNRAPNNQFMDTGLTHNRPVSWWVWAGTGMGALLVVSGMLLVWRQKTLRARAVGG